MWESEVDRRSFLSGVSAVSLAAAFPAGAMPRSQSGADKKLSALLDRFFYDRLNDDPEGATRLGLDTGTRAGLRAKLADNSAAGRTKAAARAKRELAELRAIAPASLSPAARLDHEVVAYQLERNIAATARFRYGSNSDGFAPYVLSQLGGAYRDIPDFLDSQHRVENAADADADPVTITGASAASTAGGTITGVP